jgi:hypothetical protein
VTGVAAHAEGAVRPRRPFISRKVSPALFAAILVAFALPFGTVQCQGPPVEFTGYELATWRVQQTTPPAKADDGESLPTVIERKGSAMAFVMLVSAVLGLVLGLAGRRGAGIAVAIGLVGAFVLWVQALDINNGAEPKDGLVLATVLLVVLGLWHAVLAIRRRRLPGLREPTLLPPGAVSLGLPEHPTRR